ncbi:MAG: hypothetical protein ACI80F_001833, partial [Natronomonas sp.]
MATAPSLVEDVDAGQGATGEHPEGRAAAGR